MSKLARATAGAFIPGRRTPVTTVRRDLEGKTVVFTGGTDGMGLVAVRLLAEMNATLCVLGRNPEKTERVVDAANRLAGEARAFGVACDLASLASVRACAATLLESCSRIDLLVNCAGMTPWERKLSADGFEMSWAVNHLGHFLLTVLLLDRLKRSAPARVVNLSSAMERLGHIHFDDLQLERNWSRTRSYAQAKLAMNMTTIALARRLEGTGVTVNALNPGFIRTALLRDFRGPMRVWGRVVMQRIASPPEVGAERIIRVALSPEYEGVTGRYIYEDEVGLPNAEALDDDIVERVWSLSREAVGT